MIYKRIEGCVYVGPVDGNYLREKKRRRRRKGSMRESEGERASDRSRAIYASWVWGAGPVPRCSCAAALSLSPCRVHLITNKSTKLQLKRLGEQSRLILLLASFFFLILCFILSFSFKPHTEFIVLYSFYIFIRNN